MRYHPVAGPRCAAWSRMRYWPTRRRVLNIAGEYSRRRCGAKTGVDKRQSGGRSARWRCCCAAARPQDPVEPMLTAAACSASTRRQPVLDADRRPAGVYRSPATRWSEARRHGSYVAIQFGLPWWAMWPGRRLRPGLRRADRVARGAAGWLLRAADARHGRARPCVRAVARAGVGHRRAYGAPTYLPDSLSQQGQLVLGTTPQSR
jgi:branched-chain amino acid transport system permease protein